MNGFIGFAEYGARGVPTLSVLANPPEKSSNLLIFKVFKKHFESGKFKKSVPQVTHCVTCGDQDGPMAYDAIGRVGAWAIGRSVSKYGGIGVRVYGS